MAKKTFAVADGVNWINGAEVPDSREVSLSDAEALYDKALGRIAEKAPAKPPSKAKSAAADKAKDGAAG